MNMTIEITKENFIYCTSLKTLANIYYVDEQNYLQCFVRRVHYYRCTVSLPTDEDQLKLNQRFIDFLMEIGYDVQSNYLYGKITISRYLSRHVGHSWSDCIADLKAKFIALHTKTLSKEAAAWQPLRSKFNGFIFGVDKNIDYRTSNDFAVYVQLKCGEYETQLNFVTQYKEQIIEYVIETLQSRKQVMKKVGDFRFYEITSITLLRCSELEIIFSINKNIEDILEGGQYEDSN